MNSIQVPDNSDSIRRLKPQSPENHTSSEVDSIGIDIQSLVQDIQEVNNLTELDDLFVHHQSNLDQFSNSVFVNSILQSIDSGNLNDLNQLTSSGLIKIATDLIFNKLQSFDSSQLEVFLESLNNSFFLNQSQSKFEISLKEKLKDSLNKEESIERSFIYINCFSKNFFGDLKSKIQSVSNEYNLNISENKLTPLGLQEHLYQNPLLLNNVPDSLFKYLITRVEFNFMPEVTSKLLSEYPGNFKRILNFTHNIGTINIFNFKDCFSGYFKNQSQTKIYNYLNYLIENNRSEQTGNIIDLLPNFGMKAKMNFKLFQKRNLLKTFEKKAVDNYEKIFIKKDKNAEICKSSLEIYKTLNSEKIVNSKLQTLFNQSNNQESTSSFSVEINENNDLIYEIHNLSALEKIQDNFQNLKLNIDFQDNHFEADLEGNKIILNIPDEVLNQYFLDPSKPLDQLTQEFQKIDLENLNQLNTLDPFVLKLKILQNKSVESFTALKSYQNKEFLFSSGIALNILKSNGSNYIEKKSQKYFLGNKLGSGSYGQVHYALCNLNSNYQIIAFKEICKSNPGIEYGFENEMLGSQVQSELKIPELIQVLDTGLPHQNSNQSHQQTQTQNTDHYIVLETGQDAKSFSDTIDDDTVSGEQALRLFQNCINGLKSLWYKGYCHLDFKPDNAVVFKDQFTGESSIKIIDLNLPRINSLHKSLWFRTLNFSFSKHFAIYQFLHQNNLIDPYEENHEYNLLDLIKHKAAKDYTAVNNLNRALYNHLQEKREEYEAQTLQNFLNEVAKANDLKALLLTLSQIIETKKIQLSDENKAILDIYLDAIKSVNRLKNKVQRNQEVNKYEVFNALDAELNLFRDPETLNRIQNIVNSTLNPTEESVSSELNTEISSESNLEENHSQASDNIQDPQQAPVQEQDLKQLPESESLQISAQEQAQNMELSLEQAPEAQALEPQAQPLDAGLISQESIESQEISEEFSESRSESTIILDEKITIDALLKKFYAIKDPEAKDFERLMSGLNFIFEKRNGAKQSRFRKLKNFAFSKVSFKTKLKAGALSFLAGSLISSKSVLAFTGLASIIGTSPVMPIVLMTVFFRTCSVLSLSNIFTERRFKKLLNDSSLNSNVLKLFYYAKQAVGNEEDLQERLNLNLEDLKSSEGLSLEDIEKSLNAIQKDSSINKVKDFFGGVALSGMISTLFYSVLNIDEVSNYLSEKFSSVKSIFQDLFENKPSTQANSSNPIPASKPLTPVEPPKVVQPPTTPLEDLSQSDLIPTPKASQTLGFISPTGNVNDAIQIDSNGSRVHMRGPNGENLKNSFGFKRFWNAKNPWVRVDLNNPKVVTINGKQQVIYQTLLKGKLSGRWIAGAVLNK